MERRFADYVREFLQDRAEALGVMQRRLEHGEVPLVAFRSCCEQIRDFVERPPVYKDFQEENPAAYAALEEIAEHARVKLETLIGVSKPEHLSGAVDDIAEGVAALLNQISGDEEPVGRTGTYG